MTLLIALGHRMRSGKDTVADYLVEHHGFVKLSFADPLKEGVNLWHGWGDRHAYGDLKEVVDDVWGYSPRYAYQNIGTNCIRDHHLPDFWAKAAMLRAKKEMSSGMNVVFADCRFMNEADAVKKSGGLVWRVDRPSLPPQRIPPNNKALRWFYSSVLGRKFDHESEVNLSGWDGWDHIIDNSGNLYELYGTVEDLIGTL